VEPELPHVPMPHTPPLVSTDSIYQETYVSKSPSEPLLLVSHHRSLAAPVSSYPPPTVKPSLDQSEVWLLVLLAPLEQPPVHPLMSPLVVLQHIFCITELVYLVPPVPQFVQLLSQFLVNLVITYPPVNVLLVVVLLPSILATMEFPPPPLDVMPPTSYKPLFLME